MTPEPKTPKLAGLGLQIGKTYLDGPHWLLSRPNLLNRSTLLPNELISPFHPLPFPAQFFNYILADPQQLGELNPGTTLDNWRKVARQWIALDFTQPDPALPPSWQPENLIQLAQSLGWNCKTVDGWWLLEAAQPIPISQQLLGWARSHQRCPGYLLSMATIALGLSTSWLFLLWAVLAGWLLFAALMVWRARVVPLQLEWLRQPLPSHLQDPTCRDQICAAVIAYNPAPSLIDNLHHLLPQVKTVLLIDNASTQGREVLSQAAHLPGVVWLPNPTNLGLGVALNQAANYTLAHGYEWLATFDQDSRITPQYFERLLATLLEHPQPSSVGLLGGRPMMPTYGSLHVLYGTGAYSRRSHSSPRLILTSGNLVRRTALAQVCWDEKLFIDSVDHEFNLHLSQHRFRVVRVMRAFFLHQLDTHPQQANEQSTRINSVRTYYEVRNRLVLVRRYATTHPWLCLAFLVRTCLTLVSSLRPGRSTPRKYAWQGLRDALRGRLGPYPGD